MRLWDLYYARIRLQYRASASSAEDRQDPAPAPDIQLGHDDLNTAMMASQFMARSNSLQYTYEIEFFPHLGRNEQNES